MAKNKKRIKKNRSKSNRQSNKKRISSQLNRVLKWLAAIGLLPVIITFLHEFITGDTQIAFQKPVGRGYEFKISNNNPTDQQIESFRIVPDFDQKFIFKITENVYGEFGPNGVSLPGGSTSYVPAYEYRGLDGKTLAAKSAMTFRVPPLASRSYMQPDAMVLFVQYKTRSKNILLNAFEHVLAFFNIRNGDHKIKYLVVENYWTPMGSNDKTTAIQVACRNDDQFAKSSICKEQQ